MTFEQIKELIEIVTRQRLQRFEIERAGFRLVIDGREGVPVATAAASAPRSAEVAAATPAVDAAPETSAPAAAEPEPAPVADGLHILKSPIVGTFYAAPNPEAEPYVSIGERVKRGQVLCIVEAMKLMNEIESDVNGVLREIFPKNAQPVEFGEALFAIEPD